MASQEVGRNDPCPCGSGKKYKACCWIKKQPGRRKISARVLTGSGSLMQKAFGAGGSAEKPAENDLKSHVISKGALEKKDESTREHTTE